jgi:Tol biopolymer transport system component/DNA-binding winged helix-turn-helix (wHTH) protein
MAGRQEGIMDRPTFLHGAAVASGSVAGFAFGPFVVDAVKRQLWREGTLVPITSKTFDVLVVLLEHRDHIVSKDELLNRVWPETSVNENNLARQISSLRRALGQRPDQHDFLVTVPGQGYRFVGSVQGLPVVARKEDGLVSGQQAEAEPRTQAPDSDAVSTQWTWRLSIGTLVGSSLGFLAATMGVLLLSAPRPQPTRTLQRVTFDEAALPRDAAWAPGGQWVVYASDRSGNADIWKQRVGDPDPIRLTASDHNESQPQWSPDGQAIVFRSERDGGGLYVIPASGGVERLISNFGYEPVWSPDGTLVLFKRSEVLPDLPTIYVVGLDGKPPRPVRPDVLGQFRSLHAAWRSDSRQISVWGTIGKEGMRFLNVPLDGGVPTAPEISTRVRQDLERVSPGRFTWAISRRYLYFEGRAGDTQNIWRVTVDPLTEKWIAGPERLTTGAGQETNLAVSADGGRLVFTATSSRTRLWEFPFDAASGRITGEPYPITEGATGEVDFDVRADGSKIAYQTVRAGRNELWERSTVAGEERLLLSSTDSRLAKPLWSPDGAKLAFLRCARRDNSVAVAVLNTDGSGDRVLALPRDVEMQGSDWSKDGQAILGACRFNRSGRYSTCLVPLSGVNERGDSPVHVIASDSKRNLYNQRFSPDQRWITFLAHDLLYASTSTVYVIPAAGGAWRAITDGAWFDDKPRWGPDGRILYFVSNRTGVANVWGRRFDNSTGTPVGEPFPVTSFRSAQFVLTPRTVQMDIAIAATRLVLPMSESRSDIWMLDQIDR